MRNEARDFLGAGGAIHQVSGGEVGGTNWSSSLFKGLGIGYYWSDHVKTEIEAAWPGPTVVRARPFVTTGFKACAKAAGIGAAVGVSVLLVLWASAR